MKLFKLILFTFCIPIVNISAQELFAEFEPELSKPKISQFLLANDDDGNLGICYHFYSKFYFYKISPVGKVIDKKIIPFNNSEVTPRAAIFVDNEFVFFYSGTNNKSLGIKISNNENTKAKIFLPTVFDKKEKYVGVLATNKDFYQINRLRTKGKSYLIFYKYEKKINQLTSKTEAVNNDIAYEFNSKKILLDQNLVDDMQSRGSLKTFSNTSLLEPEAAANLNKIYLQEDGKIVLTIDGKSKFQSRTLVVTFDWENASYQRKLIGMPSDGNDGFGFYSSINSFLKGNQLYRIHIKKKNLELNIYDLDTAKEIKSFSYTKDQPIDIMDSQVFTETEGFAMWVSDQVIPKSETKVVLRKLAKGTPFIYVEDIDNEKVVFTIGNYIIQKNNYYAPGGGAMTSGWSYGNSYTSARYFFAMFDKNSFDNFSGNATKEAFLSKDLNRFLTTKIKSQNENLLFSTKSVYNMLLSADSKKASLVSFLRKEKKIKIHKIDLGTMKE